MNIKQKITCFILATIPIWGLVLAILGFEGLFRLCFFPGTAFGIGNRTSGDGGLIAVAELSMTFCIELALIILCLYYYISGRKAEGKTKLYSVASHTFIVSLVLGIIVFWCQLYFRGVL